MNTWRFLVRLARTHPSSMRMLGADAAIVASFVITWLVPGLGFGYLGNAFVGLGAYAALLFPISALAQRSPKWAWRNPLLHRGLVDRIPAATGLVLVLVPMHPESAIASGGFGVIGAIIVHQVIALVRRVSQPFRARRYA